MKDNIVLIGFMGSGKTSVGISLSYRLKRTMIDTDKRIEQRQKMTVSEIFASCGEEAFREMETMCLKELIRTAHRQIISVGGGLPVRTENHSLLKQLGKVFYLKASPETIYERLKNDTTRPLLQVEDPMGRIRELLGQRSPIYQACADVTVEVAGKPLDEIAEEIVRADTFMKLLVINGPNINFLGIREKSVYGKEDYDYLLDMIAQKARECGIAIEVFQSNHEGAIIDRIQDAYFDGTEGIVINPGAYTHYSYAIRDALASVDMPKVEIHISDITRREEFRKVSVTAPACHKQIYGHGLPGYLEAVDAVLEMIHKN